MGIDTRADRVRFAAVQQRHVPILLLVVNEWATGAGATFFPADLVIAWHETADGRTRAFLAEPDGRLPFANIQRTEACLAPSPRNGLHEHAMSGHPTSS